MASVRIERLSPAALDVRTLHDVLRLRSDVFVVEQACVYADIDGRDLEATTRHVLARDGADLHAYLRTVVDGEAVRVGRVVTAPAARGRGLARMLVTRAIGWAGDAPVVLDAQVHLADFYRGLGFTQDGQPFDDAGILHVPMRRAPPSGAGDEARH